MKKLCLSLCMTGFTSVILAQHFTEISQQANINHVAKIYMDIYPAQGGVAWFDYNNDGWQDLYLTGGAAPDKFYCNNGDGTFSDSTAAAGFDVMANINTMGVYAADIDNDGYRDVFITTDANQGNYLFHNNGNGTFTDISTAAGIVEIAESSSAAFGDYNNDGFLDIYVANWCKDLDPNQQPPYLFPAYLNNFYLNNGNNSFTDIAQGMNMADTLSTSLGVLFTDYDMDSDLDVFVANDFGQHENNENALFRNEYPQNNFTDVSIPANVNIGMNGMGMARGDYDEDGDLDYYITNMGTDVLMQNNGDGTFNNVIAGSGLENPDAFVAYNSQYVMNVAWGTAFFDYDHDTYLDLFVANGDLNFDFPYPSLDSNKLYHNNGDGTFTDVTEQEAVGHPYMSRGFAHADFDNDGDLDMLVSVVDTAVGYQNVQLYRNESTDNWLMVELQGTVSNRDGFGAKIWVVENGRRFLREVDGGSSFISHHSSIAHFGLASYATVDSVIVEWSSGHVDELANVGTNQYITVIENTGIITEANQAGQEFALLAYPNPARDFLNLQGTPTNEPLQVRLMDMQGRLVRDFGHLDFSSGKVRLDLGGLVGGVYLVEVKSPTVVSFKRLVVEH